VRTEIEWLRRGPKARTTKSKARIDTANAMIGQLAAMDARTAVATAGIDFDASQRKTKRLVEFKECGLRCAGRDGPATLGRLPPKIRPRRLFTGSTSFSPRA
jgi:ABC transport system ATP-binding/permease protein